MRRFKREELIALRREAQRRGEPVLTAIEIDLDDTDQTMRNMFSLLIQDARLGGCRCADTSVLAFCKELQERFGQLPQREHVPAFPAMSEETYMDILSDPILTQLLNDVEQRELNKLNEEPDITGLENEARERLGSEFEARHRCYVSDDLVCFCDEHEHI